LSTNNGTEEGKFTSTQIEGLNKLYEQLAKEYPKSDMVKRIPLHFSSGASCILLPIEMLF